MRALVLSGGGSKGAYQVGVLKHLINDLSRQYDILCGVSVGALNCSYLSMFPKEDEKKSLVQLEKFWFDLDTSKVWKSWFPFGRLHALWLKSLYNSTPLIDMVHRTLDLEKVRNSGRKVSVGAVSLTTGNYRAFTQDDDSFVDGVLASSAFPSGLKPIMIEGELYTDGGVKHVTPLASAIKLGAAEVDMVLCAPAMTTASYDNNDSTIGLAMRTIDLMSDQIVDSDLKLACLYNKWASDPNSGKRFVKINTIRPAQNLPVESLNFEHDQILSMIEKGYQDAIDQLK